MAIPARGIPWIQGAALRGRILPNTPAGDEQGTILLPLSLCDCFRYPHLCQGAEWRTRNRINRQNLPSICFPHLWRMPADEEKNGFLLMSLGQPDPHSL